MNLTNWLMGVTLLVAACDSKKSADTTEQTTPEKQTVPYSLLAPTRRFTLPPDLVEVSGLSYYRKNQLLCVQDEKAVVYMYDLKRKAVVDSSVFGGYGDFEGVEFVKDEIYTLKSNGELFHFKPSSKQIAKVPTDLPDKTEVEGLGYDPQTERLLIAVKEGGKKKEKVVYMYDPERRVVWQGLTLKDDALEEAGIKASQFKPSGIAVHPLDGTIYLLSSTGKRLVVIDRKGKIVASESLDAKLFRQPEGICFDPDGTLYIASEGRGKAGYILEFANR